MTSEELELAKSVIREAKSFEVIDTPEPTDPTEIIFAWRKTSSTWLDTGGSSTLAPTAYWKARQQGAKGTAVMTILQIAGVEEQDELEAVPTPAPPADAGSAEDATDAPHKMPEITEEQAQEHAFQRLEVDEWGERVLPELALLMAVDRRQDAAEPWIRRRSDRCPSTLEEEACLRRVA